VVRWIKLFFILCNARIFIILWVRSGANNDTRHRLPSNFLVKVVELRGQIIDGVGQSVSDWRISFEGPAKALEPPW